MTLEMCLPYGFIYQATQELYSKYLSTKDPVGFVSKLWKEASKYHFISMPCLHFFAILVILHKTKGATYIMQTQKNTILS